MSPAARRRLLDASSKELWGIVGRNQSTGKTRVFTMSFGFSNSAEEAVARVRQQYLKDPAFRRDYAGWVFSPFLSNLCFEIAPTGASMIYNNYREHAVAET